MHRVFSPFGLVFGMAFLAAAAGGACSSSTPGAESGDGGIAAADGAGNTADTSSGDFCSSCTLDGAGAKIALPADSELSGIAASAVHEGVFYVHNDSGDSARFFAIDSSGTLLSTLSIDGATANDWEDIDVGPCESTSDGSPVTSTATCVYLADIGDNNLADDTHVIYRVPEPASFPEASAHVVADALPFSYPDGPHNAETFLVDPRSGRLAVITKASSTPSGIYLFPPSVTPGQKVTLTRVGSVTIPSGGSPLVTGGDIAPDRHGILLRTYSNLWFFAAADGEDLSTILARTPCPTAVANEVQGEAVGWLRSGDGYVTVSEGVPTLRTSHCSVTP